MGYTRSEEALIFSWIPSATSLSVVAASCRLARFSAFFATAHLRVHNGQRTDWASDRTAHTTSNGQRFSAFFATTTAVAHRAGRASSSASSSSSYTIIVHHHRHWHHRHHRHHAPERAVRGLGRDALGEHVGLLGLGAVLQLEGVPVCVCGGGTAKQARQQPTNNASSCHAP